MKRPVLYLIGLGPSSEHLTLQALEILSSECEEVFHEQYTSIPREGSLEDLEKRIGKKIRVLGRRDLEDLGGEEILRKLREGRVTCLTTWGDPLIATTHISLVTRVVREGYAYRYIPGINSVTTALASTGLMIYRLGKIATITYPRDNIVSEYPYIVLRENLSRNMHTLFLLDIDSEKRVFMSAGEAAEILLQLEDRFRENIVNPRSIALAVSIGRGIDICGGEIDFIAHRDPLKKYPQTLIIPAKLYFTEEEYLRSLGLLDNNCVSI